MDEYPVGHSSHVLNLEKGKKKWAKRILGNADSHLYVAVIDPSALGGVDMYTMSDLVKITRANPQVHPGKHERVCVHRIPRSAIVGVYTFQEFSDVCFTKVRSFCLSRPKRMV